MTKPAEAEPMVSGARSALLYLIGSLFQGLGLVLIQPFAIRILDAEQWGLVSTAVVTIQVVVVLLSAGLPLAITQRWFSPENGKSRSLAIYGFLSMICLAIGLVAAAVVAISMGVAGDSVPWSTVLAMFAIGLLGAVLGAQAVLRAQDRPMSFVALSIGSSVVANLAGVAAIVLFPPSAANYLGAYTVAVFATSLIAVLWIRPKAPWRVPGVIRESTSIAVPLLPHTGALMLLTQGAVILLAATVGAGPAGQYGAVLIFALGPLTVLNALNNSWATRIMSAPSAQFTTVLRKVSTEALLSSLAVGLLASAGAVVGSMILSRDPELLAPVAQVLPLLSTSYALFLILSNVIYVLDRTRLMAYLTPLSLLVATFAALPFALAGNLFVVAAVHAGGFAVLALAYWLSRASRYRRRDPAEDVFGLLGGALAGSGLLPSAA
jgi:O-antigen/teichoic acid export membrane protein